MNTAITTNRPSLAFYHANATGTGCAAKFELYPAHDTTDGSILARFAVQKTVGDRFAKTPTYPAFDWDGEIAVRLTFGDICKLIQVFRGECESIDDGKGLFHISAEHSTKVVLRHVIEPLNSYSLEVYRAYRDGSEDATARIMLTSAEAMGLCCALENAMAAICFGDGCNAPLLSKTPGNDNSATATVTGGEHGNMAAMREALEMFCGYSAIVLNIGMFNRVHLEALLNKAKAALAKRPRNCDKGTAEELTQRFRRHCDTYFLFREEGEECVGCPLVNMAGHCEFNWAQMPYEEGGVAK